MLYIWSNFATSTLHTEIAADDAQLRVATGDGDLFPLPGLVGEKFAVVLENDDGTLREIVECTARTTDVLTITRGCEETSARSWPAGTIVRHQTTRDALTWMSRAALDFNRKYLGPAALPPTVDANGDELEPGCMYYDTQERAFFFWDGDAWVEFGSGGGGGYGDVSNFTDLDDVPASYVGSAGFMLVVNETEDGIEFVQREDKVSAFWPFVLPSSHVLIDHKIEAGRQKVLPANCAGTAVGVRTAATAATVLLIYKYDGALTQIGTITITGTTPVLATSGGTEKVLNGGEHLIVMGPVVPDATLALISVNMRLYWL